MNNVKRVLLVVPVGYLGGAENLFLSIAKNLPSFGISPILACMRPGLLVEQAKSMGIQAAEFEEHRYRNIMAIRRARQWLTDIARKNDVDLIHSTHTAHLYADTAARRARIPEIWHLHDHPNPRDWVDKYTQRLKPDHIIFATNVVKRGFPRLLRYPHSIIHPTCVDIDRLLATPLDRQIRVKYSLPSGPMILTVARLQAYKGHRVLIEAAQRVLKVEPAAVFAIVGKATNAEQEAYLSELKQLVAMLGLTERVHLLGFVGSEDLANLLREASILVHPALSEGFSVSIQEAMAMSVPVIATDADGPKELLETWGTGIMVEKGNSESLAEQIVNVLKDKDLAQKLSKEGFEAAQKSRLADMVRRTVEVYQSVVAQYSQK